MYVQRVKREIFCIFEEILNLMKALWMNLSQIFVNMSTVQMSKIIFLLKCDLDLPDCPVRD